MIPTMNLTVPATAATAGTGPSWYYYEFAATGAENNGREGFILVAGHLIAQQVVSANGNQARGFAIPRMGTLIYYEDPNQIPP